MIALERESHILPLRHYLSRLFRADWHPTTDVQISHFAPGLRLLLHLRGGRVFCPGILPGLFCHFLQSEIHVAIMQAQCQPLVS